LCGNSFFPEDVSQFFSHSKIPLLTKLHIYYNDKFDDNLMKEISQCKSLKILHLESSTRRCSNVTNAGLLQISKNCNLLEKIVLKFSVKYLIYPYTFENDFFRKENFPHLKFVETDFSWSHEMVRPFLKTNDSIVAWLETAIVLVKAGIPRHEILNAFGPKILSGIRFGRIYEF